MKKAKGWMSSKARQVSDAGDVQGSAAASAAAPKRPDAATGRRRAGAKPGCRQQLSAGSEFLPDVGTEDLDERLHGMGSGKVRDMLAACHKRKSGWRVSEIAADMHKPYTTIRDWLVRASERGLDDLPDRKPPGRPRMLGAADHQNLKEMLYMGPQKCGFQAGSWQTRGILRGYSVRYGVPCEPRTLQRAMHRMRFSYRKPRSVPYNSASPEEQERFMRSVKKRAGIAAEGEYAVLTEDEAEAGFCNVIGRQSWTRIFSKRRQAGWPVCLSGGSGLSRFAGLPTRTVWTHNVPTCPRKSHVSRTRRCYRHTVTPAPNSSIPTNRL